jgi:hypothetical protein
MARTIGLAVGMVLLAALVGVGTAWYFVRKARRGGSGLGPSWGPGGLGAGGIGGGGNGGIMGAMRHGHGNGLGHAHARNGAPGIGRGGSGSFNGGWGGPRPGPGPAGGMGPAAPAAAPYGGRTSPQGGVGARLPVHLRQPTLEAQLHGQQQRRQEAGASAQQQHQGQDGGRGGGFLAAAAPQPRMHHWRPLAPRPAARESPFASLLEEEDEGAASRGPAQHAQQHAQQGASPAAGLAQPGLPHARHRA